VVRAGDFMSQQKPKQGPRPPHSPVGAVANELDGLKVALHGLPPGRGARHPALNHTQETGS
jgi:hypothetical protein